MCFAGETIMKDGNEEGIVSIALPQLPLPDEQEMIVIMLETPQGAPAVLSDDSNCSVTVRNDLGKMTKAVVAF